MPFFSVIIPLYNKENHIKHTLKSVLAQTFKDFEVIVINDGSTDNSLAEVNTIKDARIQVYTIKNQGVSYARNYGVDKAAANLIVLLDADDFWLSNHLENLKKLYQKFPDCGLYATAYKNKFGKYTIVSKYNNVPEEKNWMGIINNFFECSLINCIASASSVMLPKPVYKKMNGFNIQYNFGEDIDFWIRLALNYPVAFSNTPSVVINMIAENRASTINITTSKHLNLDIFEEAEKCYPALKMYLDLNRFALAIRYKLHGNTQKAAALTEKITFENLNKKQRFLLKLNTPVLKLLMSLKRKLNQKGIRLSVFE